MTYAIALIFLAAFMFSSQFIFSKLYGNRTDGSLIASVWMSALYSVWLLIIFLIINGMSVDLSSPRSIMYAGLSMLAELVGTVSSVIAMRRGKISIVTLYMLVGGQAIPFVYGILFTNAASSLGFLSYAGFALMLLSFVPTACPERAIGCKESEKAKTGRDNVFLALCVTAFFANGAVSVFTDMNAKALSTGVGVDSYDFLIIKALFGIAVTAVMIISFGVYKSVRGDNMIKSVFGGFGGLKYGGIHAKFILIMIAITGGYTFFNGLGNVFSLSAASTSGMQASFQFPVMNSLMVIMTALFSRIFFKEKLTKKICLSIFLAVTGILMLMVDMHI